MENVRLRRENAQLKRTDAAVGGRIGRKITDNRERGRGYLAKSYVSYIKDNFLSSPLYYIYDKVVSAVRPLMWIMRVVRFLLIAVAVMQVSAALLVLGVIIVALLPVILVVSLANLLFVMRGMKRMKPYLRESLENKRAVAFFSPAFSPTFFDTAFALTARGSTVFCVCDYKTPKAFRPKLLTGISEPYKGVFIVREHYWFLAKKIIEESGVYITVVS